jgi:glycosyltransferase involved in cell wall biosynthesis
LVVGQRQRRHEVCVAAIVDRGREADQPVVQDLIHLGITTDVIGVAPRAYGAERRAVRAALERHRADVVHTHGARVDVIDAPVARRAGVPTVTTVHGFTGGGLKNRLYEYLQRRAMRRADAVVAVSAPLAAELAAWGIPSGRVHMVPNAWTGDGAPLGRDDARAALGVPDGPEVVLGWVGRLTAEKGADLFIEAVARLQDLGVRGVVIGDGPKRSWLERRATSLRIAPRLTWTGSLPRADRVLAAFDVFVLSSRTEGTPIVLFEAMAAGVPIVATNVGGIPHVVRAAEAVLVPADDVGALAAGLRRTLGDPDAAHARVRAATVRLATEFTVEPWLDRYDAVYREVIRRPGQASCAAS